MCLITTQKTAKIAEEDIVVYKGLMQLSETECKSIYQWWVYTLGQLYKTEIQEDDEWCAYDSKATTFLNSQFRGWSNGEQEHVLKCIGPGYHACITLDRLPNDNNIYQCTIPKGSEYYVDATGLIVSNQIIINKRIL